MQIFRVAVLVYLLYSFTGLILRGGNEGDCLDATLVPLKSRNLQFPHRVPFTQKENALVPLPFKKRSERTGTCQ